MSKNSGINKLIGASILSLSCFFLFLGNIEKIVKINSIIIPILIVFILFVGVKNLSNVDISLIEINTQINSSFYWIIQSILYASYNLILLIPVLINLKKLIKNQRQIAIISIFTWIIITLISILIFLLLINVNISFSNLEMPIVYVIKNNFNKLSCIYGVIILIAIFTTAISAGFSFLNNICISSLADISKSKKQNSSLTDIKKKRFPQIALILCISSIIISNFGFSNLVKIIFPMFGYLGIIQICFIAKK